MVGKKGWRKGKREKSFSISFPSLSLSSRVSSFVTRFRDFISNRVDKRIVLESKKYLFAIVGRSGKYI